MGHFLLKSARSYADLMVSWRHTALASNPTGFCLRSQLSYSSPDADLGGVLGGEGEGGFHGNGGGFHGEKLSITGAVDVVGIGGNVGMFGIM